MINKWIITGIIAMCLLGSHPVFAVEIIAHRGASHDAPENTLSSFKLGYKQGADADELDICLSKDGKIVVIHDGNTARISGVTNKVETQTAAELRQLEVGQWGSWQGRGFSEKIPLLDEVLPLVPEGKRLFIEIKSSSRILPELRKTLKRGGKKPEQTVIIGFDYKTMQQAKAKFPQLKVLWLVSSDSKTKQFPAVEELIQKARVANLDGLNVNSGFPINREFVEKVHDAGLKLYTWTVDDAEVARKEVAAGVDGITTNRPEWMREQLTSGTK